MASPRCFLRLLYAIAEIPELGVEPRSTGTRSGSLCATLARTRSLDFIFRPPFMMRSNRSLCGGPLPSWPTIRPCRCGSNTTLDALGQEGLARKGRTAQWSVEMRSALWRAKLRARTSESTPPLRLSGQTHQRSFSLRRIDRQVCPDHTRWDREQSWRTPEFPGEEKSANR